MESNQEIKNIMLDAMKSYASTKINETKEKIKSSKPKNGLQEDMNIGDTFDMKVTKH